MLPLTKVVAGVTAVTLGTGLGLVTFAVDDALARADRDLGVAVRTAEVVTDDLAAAGAADRRPGATARVLERGLDALVAEHGFPAAVGSVGDGRRTWDVVSDRRDAFGARVPTDGYVRVGSNSKTYLAVVVLQLVEEGEVGLDEPVETYLPGLLRGEGIDGAAITVRQLLQHTSGLPEYLEHGEIEVAEGPDPRYFDPRQLLDIGLSRPADFAPGTSIAYSNTNYVVLGLLAQRVTGAPLHELVEERVLERADLDETYVPRVGENGLRDRHVRGYHAGPAAGTELVDVTDLDASWAWAAGDVVATPSDLGRFFVAVQDGTLLEPATVAEMQRTQEMDMGEGLVFHYGLGIQRVDLPDGTVAWGHGGDVHGFSTRVAATPDGRFVAVAVNALPSSAAGDEATALARMLAVDGLVETAFPAAR